MLVCNRKRFKRKLIALSAFAIWLNATATHDRKIPGMCADPYDITNPFHVRKLGGR